MIAGAINFLMAITLGSSLILACSEYSLASGKEFTPEEIVAAHLKSIETPGLRENIKNRGVSGKASIEFIQGGVGNLDGQFLVVSAGRNLSIIIKCLSSPTYPGEYFAFDGKDVEVATISPGQRSPLGDFIFRYNGLMKEGLLGGVWSLGWPLRDIGKSNASLKYTGAKIEGRELHQIDYSPKGGMNDIKIKLFFEPGTFHHVRTEYMLRVQGEQSLQAGQTVTQGAPSSAGLTGGRASGAVTRDAGIQDRISYSYYRLVEKFGSFKEARFLDPKGSETGSLTMPYSYSLEYSVEGQGSSFLARWHVSADQWLQNGNIDASVFKAH